MKSNEKNRAISLISLYSAEISALKAEEIAKSICSFTCKLFKTEDLTTKIFGEPVESSYVDLIRDFVIHFHVSDELIERIGDFDIAAMIEKAKELN